MVMKFRVPFSSRCLCQCVSMVYPKMIFLSRSSSSSINGFNGGMGVRSKSEENLNKLNECMDNMDDDVSKLFMEYHQTDFREDPELIRLLNDYFTASKAVSKLCKSLRNCLEKAENDLLIAEALRDFRSGDFLKKSQNCHEGLAKIVVKLEKTMKEIDKNLKRARGRRAIITGVILAPMVTLIFACKIIAGVVPLDALTTFAALKWRKTTEALKRKMTAMTSMERGTMVALKEVEKITRLVNRLENVERYIRVTAEVAVKKRSSVAVALGGMEEERKRLESTLVDLKKETGRCGEFAVFGRTVALEKISEFLSCGEKTSG